MSGTGDLNATIPAPVSPLVDANRNITVPWRAYLLVLQRRTGGTAGASVTDSAKLVDAERDARINADQALQIAIDTGTGDWHAAVDAEAAARIAADANLNTIQQGAADQIAAEILRATAAEALLVPLDQLCALWAGCDLSFLPTADPGLGMPWLDGNHVAIGSSSTILVDLGLEDVSGTWLLEDGSGSWQWG
jgi:hypothetical protein